MFTLAFARMILTAFGFPAGKRAVCNCFSRYSTCQERYTKQLSEAGPGVLYCPNQTEMEKTDKFDV